MPDAASLAPAQAGCGAASAPPSVLAARAVHHAAGAHRAPSGWRSAQRARERRAELGDPEAVAQLERRDLGR